MTGRARVHARGRRRDTPPSEPAQPEAVRGRPMPPVPRTDPPLSFADLVRRGTAAVRSLALFPLCKNAAFPEKREIGCSAGIAPLLLWSSLLPREREQAEAHEKSQTPRLGCPCGQALSPLLASLSHVCLHRCTQAFFQP